METLGAGTGIECLDQWMIWVLHFMGILLMWFLSMYKFILSSEFLAGIIKSIL